MSTLYIRGEQRWGVSGPVIPTNPEGVGRGGTLEARVGWSMQPLAIALDLSDGF
jgi:hypothetical protein